MLVHYETLIQYFKVNYIRKDLANKLKNRSKYLVGPAIEVEVPPVTGCTDQVWKEDQVDQVNQDKIPFRSDRSRNLAL